ncbi:Pyridoxal-dependent decarboxylase [[Actinomadura] parvosata subsp. kistnae]|uniref:Aspartate aminotransferase family protein n=1 Tax=[Actinomadura] parvosata subsp. kistnae TaxID=1909395 RepID=A0A1V0AD90_9ACTN|nr:aspartate aminotransferase family protein [Nonomuraea sp. ATCC 55076]AQZ68139.1 aspartate aminotransferase family protein [Nonomuraea sp. ATCC 55076]SPL93472.1 Pyridoxal-dependent decarboxylase [Actinomadura parvosata subsp. kistnae]
MNLPPTGRTTEDLLAEVARLKEHDLPVRGGQVTAYVYDTGRAGVHDAATRAYLEMLEVNCLDPTAFPSVVEMERQVVGAVADLLGGGHGIFTSGGTESIMLAVKAARDRAARPRPNLVLPVTAHPAFHKAAHYLGVEVRAVPVDLETYKVRARDVAGAVDEDTILVVASAPSYPQGVIDPIEEIAAAVDGVPFHVDACVGGWLLPWLREAGADVPPFDLSVPGVTSISCDLHKFGYAPKGASVLLFADPAMRRKAYFASAAWPGYTIINATVQSSRSAGPLGGAWATLQALGRDGYAELGRATLEATRRLREGLAAIPGLRVLGEPESSLVAFEGAGVDVFVLADEARARGWFLQPQLSYAGIPANLHITVTGVTLAGVEALLKVIAESAEAARERGPVVLPDGLVELVAGLDLEAIDDAAFAELSASVGVDLRPGAGQPEMAVVNTVLDALPAPAREAVLVRFLSVVYGR